MKILNNSSKNFDKNLHSLLFPLFDLTSLFSFSRIYIWKIDHYLAVHSNTSERYCTSPSWQIFHLNQFTLERMMHPNWSSKRNVYIIKNMIKSIIIFFANNLFIFCMFVGSRRNQFNGLKLNEQRHT